MDDARTDLGPDALQLAFHEVECRTYDERFGIEHDHRSALAAVGEVERLAGGPLGGRLLDVGCGTGYLAVAIAHARPSATVHATDLSPGMLRRARENAGRLGARVRLCQATATALPYPDGAFSAVVSRGVLHHMDDPVAALTEWRRVVRPGGSVIVLSEPSPNADRVGGVVARATQWGLRGVRRAGAAAGRPLSAHTGAAADEQRYWDIVAMAANLHTFTASELEDLGRSAGFTEVRVAGGGLLSIAWATIYYVLVGELPALADSRRARRRAARAWRALRRLDRAVTPLVPTRQLLTVEGVFSG
jgi:ubiquinone/menaquinone biosynthesis C-methylase UbiE